MGPQRRNHRQSNGVSSRSCSCAQTPEPRFPASCLSGVLSPQKTPPFGPESSPVCEGPTQAPADPPGL